tara:strand:+ start:16642 stop:17367 length:726 start_codon:yes stop_codon:yes gene_type:complete
MAYKLFFCFLFFSLESTALFGQHGGGGYHMDSVDIDVSDTESLQRGAKYFVNYCLGCHSAKYVRYNSLIEDLGITEDELVDNLMFTSDSPFDTMEISMNPEDAAIWFGIQPPDLSLIARSRGTEYLYNFLRSFYLDNSSITGVNNLLLENTSMPHVLWELQGIRNAIFSENEFDHFEEIDVGILSNNDYDLLVKDIVTFLSYIGEPIQIKRKEIGTKVIFFLLIFLLIAYMLKKEIWKDVH